MKCPKCRYLSFEPELRCKHCGYDFSLTEASTPRPSFDELEQQDPDMPMVDLQLRSTEIDTTPAPVPAPARVRPRSEPAPVRRPAAAAVAVAEKFDRDSAPMPAPAPRPMPMPTPDLPLFLKKGVAVETPADVVEDDDLLLKDDEDRDEEESFVRVPAAPRPLVVRRRAPDTPRPSPVAAYAPARVASLNRRDGDDLLDYLRRADTEPLSTARVLPARPAPAPPAPASSMDIDAAARLKAAAVDFAVLFALNVTVVLLTLRQCDLPITGIMELPMIPMVGFLASLTVGYLLMFNVVSA